MDFDGVTSLVNQNFINYRSDTSTSGTRIPYGLYDSLCTLHLLCSSSGRWTHPLTGKYFLSLNSATGATLDTGEWLTLTRQGLSPCKMHQASLDALTPAFAAVLWSGEAA